MNKNYWPHFIIALVVFAITLGVWTVKTAIDNPVELDESFMMKYQDVDKNYYKIEKMKREFHKKYDVMPVTQKLSYPNTTFEFKIVDKTGNPVKDAKVTVLFTRPDTSKYDKKVFAQYKDGVYIARASLPLEGRWNIELKIELQGLVDYELYKLSTRRVIEQKKLKKS
ncbi:MULTISPECIES: FixH family protein [unclassified Nitratiruptor]|uniref:FixH family protein n=1 Tax=unclassified Nitratiruptor TaxID=2624044 RepID=UPI001914EA69|nr:MULTISPECIES: FixH family protein [unclassified Nitratiruptor]BCD60910.1 hypothetical protein NitYY0810_C1688 [Nitratiruptor sp. YY08-10]BCD64842.1 hypothetical protein NitYY0814_C1696 [Nitratiruptor sp. YY08-14]